MTKESNTQDFTGKNIAEMQKKNNEWVFLYRIEDIRRVGDEIWPS